MRDIVSKEKMLMIVIGVFFLFPTIGDAENIDPNNNASQYVYGFISVRKLMFLHPFPTS